jgi:hypothetical protein
VSWWNKEVSERQKLEESWKMRSLKGEHVTPTDMIIEMGKLVEKCPHDKTHWIQEINKDGEFSDNLLKRCFLCGFNVDELNVEPEFIEQILTDFDKSCELKKVSINQTKAEQKQKVFCPWCGANLIDERYGWFRYSPLYVWHLIKCARPHGIGWFLVYYKTTVNQKKKEETNGS